MITWPGLCIKKTLAIIQRFNTFRFKNILVFMLFKKMAYFKPHKNITELLI